MQAKYLSPDEKRKSRNLWEEAFPEDSESFIDYYYENKMADNQVLAIETDKGIASMLHLNPYELVINKQLWNSVYIVGVATTADSRRQGYMRILLEYMLRDLYQKQMEFCFLMPANEKIYLPFNFTYIFNQPTQDIDMAEGLKLKEYLLELNSATEPSPEQLGQWMNRVLGQENEVFCLRDKKYLINLLKELKSENGKLFLIYDQKQLVGIKGEWGLEKREQRMLICEERYRKNTGAVKPAIMARIVHLNRFLSIISLRQNSKYDNLQVKIHVVDPLIKDNQGDYNWYISKKGSIIEKQAFEIEDKNYERLDITINSLTSWLFGYHSLEQELIKNIPEWTKEIETLRGVYLDEIV